MYFSPRLFALTRGLRSRILLAAVVGLVALGAGMARLALTGWIIARVFQREALSSLVAPLLVLALLIAARGLLQYLRDSVSYTTATRTKIEIRRRLHRHILALGPSFIATSITSRESAGICWLRDRGHARGFTQPGTTLSRN